MNLRRFGATVCLVAMLAGCGGGGGSAGSTSAGGTGSSTGGSVATPTTGCSLRDRQDWARGPAARMVSVPRDAAGQRSIRRRYATVDAYIDALTATARGQRRDRYFTYLTSIAEENAFYSSGSSAGFGFRLALRHGARRVFVTEAFEGAPALAAGIDRGTEILAIGTSAANLRTVSAIMASEGAPGVTNALGPDDRGHHARAARSPMPAGTRDVTRHQGRLRADPGLVAATAPRSSTMAARKVGYVNLRTFIYDRRSGAAQRLRRSSTPQGVTDVIVDLRYNGGGLVSIAELIGDLLGATARPRDVFSYTTFRPEKASNNETRYFAPQPQSIAPTRIAFIGTGGTASASELVINAFIPYLHANAGADRHQHLWQAGRPDRARSRGVRRPAAGDRLRDRRMRRARAIIIDGLATTVEASCQAADDITYPLGDPREASTRAALDFLAGRAARGFRPARCRPRQRGRCRWRRSSTSSARC